MAESDTMPDEDLVSPISDDLEDWNYVHEAVGAASVCWENFGMSGSEYPCNSGVFEERQARAIAHGLFKRMQRPRLELANLNELCDEVARRNGEG